MQSALDQFYISIQRVRDLIALHNSLTAQTTSAVDLSDILRSALVLAVSALDYYIHEVVRIGMLEIHRGQRPEPNISSNTTKSAFSRFDVSLGNAREERKIILELANWLESEVQQIRGDDFIQQSHLLSDLIPIISDRIESKLNQTSWLEDEIRESLSFKSFQQPDKIADATRYICDKKLWDEVSQKIGKPTRDIKNQLISIVDRRNKIVHEADIDPTLNLGNRWPIDATSVTGVVDFLEKIVESIHQIL